MGRLVTVIASLLLAGSAAFSQAAPPSRNINGVDSDQDGLSDALEQHLLQQFTPMFMVSSRDCAGLPAEFAPRVKVPTVRAENGVIYGEAFPYSGAPASKAEVELHFYHLWREDCGKHGHPLDAEHVSVLLAASQNGWRALYWYAAAHQQTVCDVSQIARASTLHAQESGAQVWISPGKHASYLNEAICGGGCGADRCDGMVPLRPERVINLGEPAHPMNGSWFVSSTEWPLSAKMDHTDFPAEPLARLEQLPSTEIALFNPGRHPAQGVIAISSSTEGAISRGAADTASSLGSANDSTGDALSVAGASSGSALGTSYHRTVHALGRWAASVGHALDLSESKVSDSKRPK